MAYLLIEQDGAVTAAELGEDPARVLVGRRAGNEVVIADPSVARLHAWVESAGGRSFVTDTGTRGGTFVNGIRVTGRRALRDGDEIRIGSARLRYFDSSAPPGDVGRAGATSGERSAVDEDGILFDCTCGAPLWVPRGHAGRRGRCRYCGKAVAVPGERRDATSDKRSNGREPNRARRVGGTCGICQCDVETGERTTSCAACGLTFHADCWTENYGCAAYGCSQVNVLAPKAHHEAGGPAAEPATVTDDVGEPPAEFPWPFVLLAAAVVGALAGTLAFGSLSLIVLVCVVVYAARRRPNPLPRPALMAGAISLLGLALGAAISYFWWLGPN